MCEHYLLFLEEKGYNIIGTKIFLIEIEFTILSIYPGFV